MVFLLGGSALPQSTSVSSPMSSTYSSRIGVSHGRVFIASTLVPSPMSSTYSSLIGVIVSRGRVFITSTLVSPPMSNTYSSLIGVNSFLWASLQCLYPCFFSNVQHLSWLFSLVVVQDAVPTAILSVIPFHAASRRCLSQ